MLVRYETEDEQHERDADRSAECGCGGYSCDDCNPIEDLQTVRYVSERGCHFVNVYSVSREYGGPEEGGWWYDLNVLEEVHVLESEAAAQTKAAELQRGPYDNGDQDLGSVNCRCVWNVRVSDRPGDPYFYDYPGNLRRPVYE